MKSQSQKSRSQPPTGRRKTALAVRDKSELDLAFELIAIEMNEGFDRVQAEMGASFKEIENSLPSSAGVLSEIDTTFDMIEHDIDELIETLTAERDEDDSTVQASVAFAKELSATEDAAEQLWRAAYGAHTRAANAQARLAAIDAAVNIPRES